MTFAETMFYNPKINARSIRVQLLLLVEHIISASYTWENIPEEIEPDIPERALFYFGEALFFKYGDYHAMTQCVGNGQLNLYGRFKGYRPILYNGTLMQNLVYRVRKDIDENGEVYEQEAVIVKNNEQNLPTISLIMPVLKRLSDLWITMGIKQSLSRVKTLIEADEDSAKAFQKAVSQIVDSDAQYTVVSHKTSALLQDIKTLELYSEYEPNKDWYDFDKTWALLMTMCGVFSNADQSKRERQIVDEVNANQEVVSLVSNMGLKLRQYACKQINKLYGLNISVKLTKDMEDNKRKDLDDEADVEGKSLKAKDKD